MSKGGKKKGSSFVIDCSKPVIDKFTENASLGKFLQQRIKVEGKLDALSILSPSLVRRTISSSLPI
ncbi:60S ribosomal protein l22-2 [Phtheirospermum japonicum]|uniref:Large ribosomal subunit protein eL22 n=1 Tax=Phtheirospermum japonicum TaxID=374723 RepID=A0A830CRH5_9LAMI|nr:60S ribosomal protein l22-2 [Phtheirospermum japonicum]